MVVENTLAAPTPPKLLDQVRDKFRVKHYSICTETQYIHWAKRAVIASGFTKLARPHTLRHSFAIAIHLLETG